MLLLAWLIPSVVSGLAVYLAPQGAYQRGLVSSLGDSKGWSAGMSSPSVKTNTKRPQKKPVGGYEPGVDYDVVQGPIIGGGPAQVGETMMGGGFQNDETYNAYAERTPDIMFLKDPTNA